MNLHYIRKLSCKYDLLWLSGSGEDFQMTPPHFCIFVIVSPSKRTLPFDLNNLEFPLPKYDLYQLGAGANIHVFWKSYFIFAQSFAIKPL
jgi:hypothetical protein